MAAIRASQLGLKTAVIERESLGGICLNWGCIPTKSLLKSAQVYEYLLHAADYGVDIEGSVKPDIQKMVSRSRSVAEGMSNGIQFLFKKNKIEVINGRARLAGAGRVRVEPSEGDGYEVRPDAVILATGSVPADIPGVAVDGRLVHNTDTVWDLTTVPKRLLVVGSGAVGVEFACIYHNLGSSVVVVEMLEDLIVAAVSAAAQAAEETAKETMAGITGGMLPPGMDLGNLFGG